MHVVKREGQHDAVVGRESGTRDSRAWLPLPLVVPSFRWCTPSSPGARAAPEADGSSLTRPAPRPRSAYGFPRGLRRARSYPRSRRRRRRSTLRSRAAHTPIRWGDGWWRSARRCRRHATRPIGLRRTRSRAASRTRRGPRRDRTHLRAGQPPPEPTRSAGPRRCGARSRRLWRVGRRARWLGP